MENVTEIPVNFEEQGVPEGHRLVVVKDSAGVTYIGWIDELTFEGHSHLHGLLLKQARTIQVATMPDPHHPGAMMRAAMVMHIDMFSGPAPLFEVQAFAFYCPTGEDLNRILAMIKVSQDAEKSAGIRESGIVTNLAGTPHDIRG